MKNYSCILGDLGHVTIPQARVRKVPLQPFITIQGGAPSTAAAAAEAATRSPVEDLEDLESKGSLKGPRYCYGERFPNS